MARHPALARVSAATLLAFACAACGHSDTSRTSATAGTSSAANTHEATQVILIATERGQGGGRLVGVAVDGSRQSELTQLDGSVVLDRSPVVSPDGKWVVFASNRLRPHPQGTSLWRVSIEGGTPIRLTHGPHVDRDPRISPDAQWLYFCSNRAGAYSGSGTYNLHRAQLKDNGSLGTSEVVVSGEGQILSPSISPDGAEIVYMQVEASGESALWKAPTDRSASPVALTKGPSDMTPAWGPNGTIAFAARVPQRSDADVYLMPASGGERRVVLDTPITDETGPRWSKDGRYLFAIGMYRSATSDKPLLGSVIAIDLQEVPMWRALHDPAAVETRIGLGLVPEGFSAREIRKNKPYKQALKEVLTEALRNSGSQQSRERQ